MLDSIFTQCPKCSGQGHLDPYWKIAGGICFLCNGYGRINKRTKQATEELTEVKLNAIKTAKKQIKELGYFDFTETLMAMDFELVMDILNNYKDQLVTERKIAESKAKEDAKSIEQKAREWCELFCTTEEEIEEMYKTINCR